MRPEDAPILEQIRTAFPSEPITADGAFQPWGNGYLDAEAYGRELDGRPWEALDREYLIRRSDALGFLSTQHLAALLPVYLRAMLEDGVWSPASGMLTVILARPPARKDTGLGHARFDALVEALTPAQRGAVAATLRALAEQDEGGSLGMAALTALESYWNQYLQPST